MGGVYLRGKAYLQQKMAKEAAAEFEKILSNRAVDPIGVDRAFARVELARAYAMMGETSRARKEYQDFLALWKDADPDLEILVEAKKEYEQLK